MSTAALAPAPITRDGVGPSRLNLPVGTWPLLIDYLVERFPTLTREQIATRIMAGDVRYADGGTLTPETRYVANRALYYYRQVADEPPIPFEAQVLFEDEQIVVADKPHFLPVTPVGRYVQETLLVRLKRKLGIDTLAPMHRIDRETAGLVLFTKQAGMRGAYQTLFQNQLVEKRYQAIARINRDHVFPLRHQSRIVAAEHFMRMKEVPGAPNAETCISLVEQRGDLGRFVLEPVTGKKHQLRVQMAALGMAIVNDRIYPEYLDTPDQMPDYTQPLQLLAERIAFRDPISGEMRRFTSTLQLAPLDALT